MGARKGRLKGMGGVWGVVLGGLVGGWLSGGGLSFMLFVGALLRSMSG